MSNSSPRAGVRVEFVFLSSQEEQEQPSPNCVRREYSTSLEFDSSTEHRKSRSVEDVTKLEFDRRDQVLFHLDVGPEFLLLHPRHPLTFMHSY